MRIVQAGDCPDPSGALDLAHSAPCPTQTLVRPSVGCLLPHLEQVKAAWPPAKTLIAESGYGSKENDACLTAEGVEAHLPGRTGLWCVRTARHQTGNECQTERRMYACANCAECPLKSQCTRGGGNRSLQVSSWLNELKWAALDNIAR